VSKAIQVRCGCGCEALATVVDGNLVIRAKRHGEWHEAVVDLLELALESRRADGRSVLHARTVHQAAGQPQTPTGADPWPTAGRTRASDVS
jgi:hypothetical protein